MVLFFNFSFFVDPCIYDVSFAGGPMEVRVAWGDGDWAPDWIPVQDLDPGCHQLSQKYFFSQLAAMEQDQEDLRLLVKKADYVTVIDIPRLSQSEKKVFRGGCLIWQSYLFSLPFQEEIDDHGVFKNLNQLWQHNAHLAVFVEFILTYCDPASLVRYLLLRKHQ